MALEKVDHRRLSFAPLAEDADRKRQLSILLDVIRQRFRVLVHLEQIALGFGQRFVDRTRGSFVIRVHFANTPDLFGQLIRRSHSNRSRMPMNAAPA